MGVNIEREEGERGGMQRVQHLHWSLKLVWCERGDGIW